MKEFFEFRVRPDVADRLSGEVENPSCGFAVKVIIGADDPKLIEMSRINKELHSRNETAFYSWNFYRKYTTEEIAAAKLFHLILTATFEPAGEECGTVYDQSHVCQFCGVGEVQTSPLCLDESKIPKGKHLARTIADEWIASKNFVELCLKNEITGIKFEPIINFKKKQRTHNWYQLISSSQPLSICSPTRVGISPFDEDSKKEFCCPRGHVIGLGILSEITVTRPGSVISDWNITAQKTGYRRGLLRPRSSILISPKLRNLMVQENIKGFKTEIAHLA
jgi:hypothetical protein